MGTSYRALGSIGLIVPPRCNETVIEEALAIRPAGLAWCLASLGMAEYGDSHFKDALLAAEQAAVQLMEREVDVISYSGLPLTVMYGPDFHLELEDRLRNATGGSIPVASDSSLVIAALKAAGVGKVSIVSPYMPETLGRVVKLLEANGLEVADARGAELALGKLLTDLDDDSSYEAAQAALERNPATDGFLMACPQWPVVRAIDRLESETSKPVVTQLQAILWWALAQKGLAVDNLTLPVPLGRLLASPFPRSDVNG